MINSTNLSELQSVIEGLYYPSESDEALEIITFEKDFDPKVEESKLKKSIKAKPKYKVESDDFEAFWTVVTTPQNWWTEFEQDRMRKFLILKDLLLANLTNLTYLRIGRVEIKALIIGQDVDCNWIGIKTLIIET
jgi:hypothetical protein